MSKEMQSGWEFEDDAARRADDDEADERFAEVEDD
jgi:hypothetical protein